MNVTLKEFPPELHSRLKQSAEENGRSLNRQIIHLLNRLTFPQKASETDLLKRIVTNREGMVGGIDQDFLDQAKKEGRA